ncbi:MAG: YncE family protein [Sphingomicrobium sp.]|nr:YncE family protein [Sphingomonadales bacterium]
MRTLVLGVALLAATATLASAASPPAPAPSYHVGSSIPGPDGGWDLASVDPVAHRLYLAHGDSILAVDLASGKVTPTLIPAQRAHAALAIPGTREVLSTNGAANTATIFDGATGKVRAVIPTGRKPDAAVWDPATRTLWVMNPDSGDITVIDAASAKVLATVPVGGSLELGAADGHGHLFINVEDKNDVAVVDTRTRKLVRRFPLAGCDGPTGIAFAPDVRLLVSACANGKAIVSSPNGALRATLDIGLRPDGALYDERRHVALIPSGGDGTLAVISVAGTPRVVERVATAKSARTAALDPATGRVYLAAVDQASALGGERPKAIPGTFRIIVVEPSAR